MTRDVIQVAGCGPVGGASSEPTSALVCRLKAEVASILSRNHREVQECFESWLAQETERSRTSSRDAGRVPLIEKLSTTNGNTVYDGCQGMPALPNAVIPSPRLTTNCSSSEAMGASTPQALTSQATKEFGLDKNSFSANPKTVVPRNVLAGQDHKDAGQWRKMIQKNIEESTQAEKDRQSKGGKKRSHRANSYVMAKKKEEANSNLTSLQQVVSHKAWEWMTVALILLNAVFLGLEVQVMALDASDDFYAGRTPEVFENMFFRVVSILFCLAFVFELVMRIAAEQGEFFRTSDYLWNLFDTVIVAFSVLEVILDLSGVASEALQNVSILRVLRVVRVVKVLRIIRLLSFFRELRMMVASILGCFKSLCWAILVLLLVFYIFGISFASGTYDYCWMMRDCGEDAEDLRDRFGSLNASMLSLFMAITGGIDWGDLYKLLEPLPALHSIMFLFFISFSFIAILNVVTGIFVETAILSSQSDREVVISEQMADKKKALRNMVGMFNEMDDDNSGSVTIEEFEKHLDDERAIAYFEAMKLDVTEVHTLCKMLDLDQSGNIDMEEFVMGVEKLKGESRSYDVAVVNFELKWLTLKFETFADFMEQQMVQAAAERARVRVQMGLTAEVETVAQSEVLTNTSRLQMSADARSDDVPTADSY